MTERKDQDTTTPIGTWSGDQPRDGDDARAEGRAGVQPIAGEPAVVPLVEPEPASGEPTSSPETEHELDRLRRD